MSTHTHTNTNRSANAKAKPLPALAPGAHIAVIGAGIAGMGAAYALAQRYTVHLFEKEPQLGGHARTVSAGARNTLVDVGFIVYNHRNYPNLTALFKHLNVPTQASDMSFGVHATDSKPFTYATTSLGAFFGGRVFPGIASPKRWRLLFEILKFNKRGLRFLENAHKAANGTEPPHSISLGQFLKQNGFSEFFKTHYILAMGSAIWSTPLANMEAFPAHTFLQFFKNHGLLSINNRPKWRTVLGGSQAYVNRLQSAMEAAGVHIHTSAHIKNVQRTGGISTVNMACGAQHTFQAVVFACHANTALELLSQPTAQETQTIGAFTYSANNVCLHTSAALMPPQKKCWSSWNYFKSKANGGASLSYWMNRLQPAINHQQSEDFFVTLNAHQPPTPQQTQYTCTFHHPQFHAAALRAQSELPSVQGTHNTWYCGAYQRYGFHEDGLASGLAVARALGATPPWQEPTSA